METIINKVAESGIVTIDLAEYLPEEQSVALFDLKNFLFKEMILREKDYRQALQTHDWEQYGKKHVAITCTIEAIIPMWAYMLAASYLEPLADSVYFGTTEELSKKLIEENVSKVDPIKFTDKRVVLKGCGEIKIPEVAYIAMTARLRPVVKSLMYGEPCSTVPIYKKK